MKNSFFNNIILVSLLFVSSVAAANAQKMTAEEVVSKHLESIGEKRGDSKTS